MCVCVCLCALTERNTERQKDRKKGREKDRKRATERDSDIDKTRHKHTHTHTHRERACLCLCVLRERKTDSHLFTHNTRHTYTHTTHTQHTITHTHNHTNSPAGTMGGYDGGGLLQRPDKNMCARSDANSFRYTSPSMTRKRISSSLARCVGLNDLLAYTLNGSGKLSRVSRSYTKGSFEEADGDDDDK